MGRFLLLLLAAVGLSAITLYFGSSAPTEAAAEVKLWERADEAVAREIALSGLSDAEARLSAAFATNHAYTEALEWSGEYQEGTYEVVVAQQDSLLIVTSRGVLGETEHHVRRAFRPLAYEVPPFVRQALLVDDNIHINNPLRVTAPPSTNANVHANRHLQIRSLTSLVMGFGTASGMLQPLHGVSLPAVFLPNYNPDHLVSYASQVAPIQIPSVDVRAYRSLASQVLPRNGILQGTVSLGTRTAPSVIYAEGVIDTGSPVVFDGWGILVVDGSLHVNHALTTVGDENRSRLLVIVSDNVSVRRDNIDLAGSWFVGRHLQLRQGTRLVNGGFTVRGHYQQSGAVEIIFRELPIQLASLAWPDHLVSRSYREW